jgi:aminoglycoside phosphotransferase (APT) family kinase protein
MRPADAVGGRPVTGALPGLDLTALVNWLNAVDINAGPLSATLIAGGKSNLTYAVTDGSHRWIVRRPPMGHVLATAHDMGREYRVMAALSGSAVPVPTTYAFCSDIDVLGAPFYVMQHVEGTPYRTNAELRTLGFERTRAISERLIDTLVELHSVDVESVGLGDFGRPEGFLARQVRRWKKQMDASYNRDLPAAEELYACLEAGVPTECASGIVHGDFRLDNVLMDQSDRPAAVLDWEMATLGDPLTDLALMLMYHRVGAILPNSPVTTVANAPGFLDEAGIIQRYAAASARDLSHFGFYLGLAAYKIAAILEGIHFRYLQGQTVGEGFADIGTVVPPLLDAGLNAMKET